METTNNAEILQNANIVPTSQGLSESDISDILEENGFTGGQSTAATLRDGQVTEFSEPTEESSSETVSLEEPVQETEDEDQPTQLPLNSPTLLVDTTTTRFSGTEWYNEIRKARIIVAGIGGIGSNLCFQLARLSPECIIMYDPDTVETVNMAGQMFRRSDVGRTKVSAAYNTLYDYCNVRQIGAIAEAFIQQEPGDIMMCGFDSMAARKNFFQVWKNHVESKAEEEKAKCLYLDGRLSIDTLQIFCIRGDDEHNRTRYAREFLFRDADADPTVCSMKQTTYMTCMIGSLMTNLFTNFVANTLNPVIPYDLPFFTEYDAQNMLFKTEY